VLGARPDLAIDAGSGVDNLVINGGAYSAIDYLRMNAALSNFETVRFTSGATVDVSKMDIGSVAALTFNAGANTVTEVAGQALTLAPAAEVTASTDGIVPASVAAAGATSLTATAAGYKAAAGVVETVYGGSLNVVSATASSVIDALFGAGAGTANLTLKGSSAAVTVAATGGATAAASSVSNAALGAGSDLQSLTVNLASARGTGTNAVTEYAANFAAGTITTTNLQALSSLKVNGTGVFSINTGAIAAVDAKLTTIDVSGMSAFLDVNALGVVTSTNLSTTSITLNDLVEETVILGGAKDTVVTGSTVAAMDTIIGFQLTASVDSATTVDAARSDALNVPGTLTFAKFETTATTLIGALTAAGAETGANLVFHFGGDTYVYVDQGTAGLDDGDLLVKLVGTYDLDLLVGVVG
jgi:hypothetical protein